MSEAMAAMVRARRDVMRSVVDRTEQVKGARQYVVREMVARLVHEAHRVCCGEESRPDWAGATWRERSELLSIVERCARNPDLDAADVHEDWVERMTKAGWRHCPEFNSSKMERPEMTRFDKLPVETQCKYRFAVALVRVMRDYCEELEDA